MKNRSTWTKETLEASCVSEEEIDDLLKIIDNKFYVISRHFNTLDKIIDESKELYDYMKIGFSNERFRKHKISFRFTEEGEYYEMELRRFITNTILWRPIVELGGKIEPRHLLSLDVVTNETINTYFDKFYIEEYINRPELYRKLNGLLADTRNTLSRISLDFNLMMGMVVTIESYMGTAKKFPEFEDILRYELDTNAQPYEVEKIVAELTKKQISMLKKDKDNLISSMLECGAGVKDSSIQEFTVMGSNKPDLYGNTMPVPIDKNFIIGGLSNLINYYVDATAGRKSIILNKTEMGKSGYFAYLVTLLNTRTRLSDIDDCGSVNFVRYFVKTQKHLDMVEGRFYSVGHHELKEVKKTDTHLIGTYINIRSPITCACNEGHVCKKCFGRLSDIVAGISIGGFSAIIIMKVVQQKILSSKHILTTSSNKIEFDPAFDSYFKIYANEICPNIGDNADDKLCIIISMEDVEFPDIFEKDLTGVPITKFSVGTIKQKRKSSTENITVEILHTFEEKSGAKFLLANDIITSRRIKESEEKGVYYIPFKDIDDSIALFSTEVENNELTKPLYDIKNILNNAIHNGNKTIDDVTNAFIDCVLEAKIPCKAVNVELLLYPLIKEVDNKFKRPNFRKYVFDEDIRIMTVNSALKNNKSITIKMASEALAEQFRDFDTYEQSDSSYLDDFFRDKLLPIMERAIDNLNKEEEDGILLYDDGVTEDEDEYDE